MKVNISHKRIGDVADVAAGQGAPQGDENYCLYGTPFIKAGNLEYLVNGGDENEVQKVSDEVAAQHRLKLYPAGSIVFAKSGMSCLKGYIYVLKNDCYVVSHLAILTPQQILSAYLSYCLQYYRPNSLIRDKAYPSISLADITNFSIPCPVLDEQKSIVDELDSITNIITDKRKQLIELDNLIQSIFLDTFGDPLLNQKNWDVKKMVDICTEFRYGTSKPASTDGKYKYLRMCNITYDGYIDLSDVKAIDIPDKEIEKCIVRRGDILFNRTNSLELIGKTCMFDEEEPMVIAGYIIRVRLDDCVLPVYVARAFNMPSMKKLLRTIAKGAVNQVNINAKELALISLPLPPFSLQQKFEKKIQIIEDQKTLIKRSIKEFENLLAQRMEFHFA